VKFILASSSPRRRDLLASIGLDFDVLPSHVPEVHQAGETPQDYVARLSGDKAEAVAREHPESWVIAADTTVVHGGHLLEKPADAADAARMLSTLSAATHMVYTGVTVRHVESGWLETRVEETEVRMLNLTPAEIDWYVGTGEPLDKAGAYAAQGIGAIFIESVRGSFTNVVGLPLATLYNMLRNAGIDPLTKPE